MRDLCEYFIPHELYAYVYKSWNDATATNLILGFSVGNESFLSILRFTEFCYIFFLRFGMTSSML